MKLFFLCFFLIFGMCAIAQTGTVSGNVFWKYNDYVGNKADAGATVYLIPEEKTKGALKSNCDVSGNFRFEGVPYGNYLVIVISENTKTDGEYNVASLSDVSVGKYFTSNLREQNKPLYDSVQNLQTKLKELLAKSYQIKKRKEIKELEKENDALTKQYIPSLVRLAFSFDFAGRDVSSELHSTLYTSKKIHVKETTVSQTATSPIVVNFGLTAY
jgi:hypothetical protein